MTFPNRLPTLAALGAVVLAILAGPAAADHYFSLQNCTGTTKYFAIYNGDDVAYLRPFATRTLGNRTSAHLHCAHGKVCKVQAGRSNDNVVRVDEAITFYSENSYRLSLDADCSQTATHTD